MQFENILEIHTDSTNQYGFTMFSNLLFDTNLNIFEKMVYLAVFRYTQGAKTVAWPSIETIARDSSISQTTVKKTLNSLAEKGLLRKETVKAKNGVRNVYYLKTLSQPGWHELMESLSEAKSKKPNDNHCVTYSAEIIEKKEGGVATRLGGESPRDQEEYPLEEYPSIKRSGVKKILKSDQESDLTPEQKSTALDIQKPTNPTPKVSTELARQSEGRSLNAEPISKASPSKPISEGARVWNEYAQLFVLKYRAAPIRNAKTNAICKRLIEAVGLETALKTVAYFLSTNHSFYVQRCHDIALCLYDIHKLSVELASGERRFRQDAIKAEKAQHLHQEVAKLEIEQDLRPGENIFDKIAREYEEGKAQRDEERKRFLE